MILNYRTEEKRTHFIS